MLSIVIFQSRGPRADLRPILMGEDAAFVIMWDQI